jgi:Mg-chelatase subunit ChlD
MKSSIRMVTAAALIASAASVHAQMASVAEKPRVEVVFVLDSTGSMSGLIEGAKQKIWSIANSIVAQKPAPEVKIGLISYRDRGDLYITARYDLTDDIDAVFANLLTFSAGGGGDTPESVNQALSEAVRLMSWSKDKDVLKVIFLVGDCPPHMDYANDIKYPVSCAEAAKKGVIINTVQCGDYADTTPVWREIARRSEGSFIALAQTGNMTAVATPYDEEIAKTSAALGTTFIAYGAVERQAEAKSKVAKAAEAPASVRADRALFNLSSGGKVIQGRGDLVSDLEAGSVNMKDLKEAELPPEMQKMTPAERTAYVEKQKAAREALNTKLASLAQQRAEYIEKENARRIASGSGDSFDLAVAEIIEKQAARVW